MKSKTIMAYCLGLLLLLTVVPSVTYAAVPQLINYQGKLMEDGAPTNGFRMMIFSIWDNDIGGDPTSALWNETQTVEVTEGIYNVELGSNTALPANLYDYNDLFLQVDILHPTEGWQRLSPLMPFDSTVFAIKAAKAEDANTLDGKDSTELDQSTHLSDTNNPHNVTALQTGAAALSDITWGNLSNIPAGFADNVDNEGITTETDPTVLASVKDGVSWGELSGIPAGFADGIDNNSGGDITGVTAGTGLSGGGASGTVTLDVETPFILTDSVVGGLISVYNNYATIGFGVWSETTGSSSYAVVAKAWGSSSRAFYGWATNASGMNYGGYFKADGTQGRGVYGHASNTGDVANYGGYFMAEGLYGIGVKGEAYTDYGVGVIGNGNYFDFYAGGVGTNYGPFTGAHEVRFTKDYSGKIRPGMVVSVTGRTEARKKENGEISLSSTLPTVTLAKKAMDKGVLGVLVSEGPLPKDHWYESQEGELFGVVNALGEGRMWVTNANGDIEAGDYITSSNIPGYGQMQEDDLLHSYTLGKALETIDWQSVTETVEYNGVSYKVYLIAVVYKSG